MNFSFTPTVNYIAITPIIVEHWLHDVQNFAHVTFEGFNVKCRFNGCRPKFCEMLKSDCILVNF